MIRLARADDLHHLPQIERAAGVAFRALGMAEIADDDPPPVELLEAYRREGRALVAAPADHPVAYLLLDVVDGAAHVEQVSVHPAYAGRRLGSALLDEAGTWAARHRLRGLTLTTFADVPWNAPYYVRLGFTVLADHELTAGLRAIRDHEAARGLDRWPRVVMARPATPGP